MKIHFPQESKRDIGTHHSEKCQMITGYGSPAKQKEFKSLSEKLISGKEGNERWDMLWLKDVKEKVQNAQRRVKWACTWDDGEVVNHKWVKSVIDKIFLEEFGEKLI